MNIQKITSVTLWILCVSLALTFILAASGKFAKNTLMHENFIRWGYGYWVMLLTGIAEGIGAMLLFVRKLRILGIAILIFIMLGAAYTHLMNFEELGLPILNIILIMILMLAVFLHQKTKKHSL